MNGKSELSQKAWKIDININIARNNSSIADSPSLSLSFRSSFFCFLSFNTIDSNAKRFNLLYVN